MSHDIKNTELELGKTESNKALINDYAMSNKTDTTKPLILPPNNKKKNNTSQRKMFVAQPDKTKRKYNYPNNFVSTSKYSIITFFPKALLLQFTRYANIYFLMIAIVQLIPAVSPLSPVTAIAPLSIVLLISIVREGIEDYYRHVSDEKENTEIVRKYDGKNYIEDLSKNLEVGDIVKVEEYGIIPADMILISCKNLNKIAYLETANLDGEKNLKPKTCIPQIFNMFKDIDTTLRIKGKMIYENPNSDLSKFNGRLKINSKIDFAVNVKQLLYKGTILKNTPWAIGVVVYTGKETKIILNSQNQSSKTSHMEILVNFLILFIFFFQLGLCIILAIICSIWNRSAGTNTNYYLKQDTDPNILGLISFWSYLLLLNTMIPISLIVSIEIVKYAQGFFMNNDVEMYSSIKDKFCKVNSCTLNEELGQIKYIFSDKTGTLTANKLEFKACVIGESIYGCSEDYLSNLQQPILKRMITRKSGGRGLNFEFSAPSFDTLKNIVSYKDIKGAELNLNLTTDSGRSNLEIPYQKQLIEHYLMNLAVNQSCFTDRTKIPVRDGEVMTNKVLPDEISSDEKKFSVLTGKKEDFTYELQECELIQYKGENPDEIVFVDTARNLGVAYMGGDETVANVRIIREDDSCNNDLDKVKRQYCENLSVDILKILEFTSDRGMASVVVEYNNKCIVYSKGGDSKISALLKKDQPFPNTIKSRATKLSEKGLRVLLLAMKVIDRSQFNEWNYHYEEGIKNLNSEDLIKSYKKEKFKELEEGLILIGCTAVEDKLQDEVPEVIREVQDAGINFWVLTGDNLSTAKNIGIFN